MRSTHVVHSVVRPHTKQYMQQNDIREESNLARAWAAGFFLETFLSANVFTRKTQRTKKRERERERDIHIYIYIYIYIW